MRYAKRWDKKEQGRARGKSTFFRQSVPQGVTPSKDWLLWRQLWSRDTPECTLGCRYSSPEGTVTCGQAVLG